MFARSGFICLSRHHLQQTKDFHHQQTPLADLISSTSIIMQFFNLLLLAGTVAAIAFPSTPSKGCCCCDISQEAIVCNPNQPADDCFCPLVLCPAGAPTIVKALPKPTSPPVYAAVAEEKRQETAPEEKRQEVEAEKKRQEEDTSAPPPPPGSEWCCCCDGQNNVCSARPLNDGCVCIMIACPADAKTLYPETTSTRPGRPDRPERSERPERPNRVSV